MADDMFPMAGPSEPEAGAGAEGTPPPEHKEDEAGATALLPKSVLGGKEFSPGEEVVLKIVRVHGDEVEVAYATEEPKTEGPTADEEIDQMAAQGPGSMPAAAQEGY